MVIGGVSLGVLLLVGLGFAMMSGDKAPKKKKEAPAPAKVETPKTIENDPWDNPDMLGSETDAARRRKEGQKEQDRSGEVDRTKVDPAGGK